MIPEEKTQAPTAPAPGQPVPTTGGPVQISSSFPLVLFFILLVAGIVAVGSLYYRKQAADFRTAVEHQLAAVADLKVVELRRWREERLDDGVVFFKNTSFAAMVRRFLEQPEDTDAQSQLHSWIGTYETRYRYDQVLLLDAQGGVRLSFPARLQAVSAAVAKEVPAVLRSGKVTLMDFYRSEEDRQIHLGVMVPIFDEREADRPLGVLFLRIDPAIYFYPFIKLWPTASQTAETLLVRREGNEAVFLNELRFQSDTAMKLRSPLDQVTLPAVQAALGRTGFMDGVDYRGQPVVAALRTIPDSPWAMVARMDTAEVYAPLRNLRWQVILMTGVLILAAGAGLAAIRRQQHIRSFREKAVAAEAIRETKEYLENLINHANAPIIVWDAEGRITRFNHAFEEIAGRQAGQVLGKGLDCLFADDQRERAMAIVRQAGAGERFAMVEVPIRHTDGAQRMILWNSAPILGTDGKTQVATIAQGQDITERTRAKAALLEKNAELERFLYTASHDLKSPVVTVRTFLGYLEQDMAAANAGRIAKDVHFIRTAADKMTRLLDDLLEISRIGRIVAPPVSVTFKNLAAEALAAVAGRITERGVAVTVGDHDLTLCGDQIRLAEIWQNLVENACKFMGDQPQPRIGLGVEALAGETVFYVRDNGIGLDPRYHGKVFALFEKLDPKAEGTGIGLAMVKRIVELHQGRIWVESSGPGAGACFYFTLPGAMNPKNEGEKP